MIESIDPHEQVIYRVNYELKSSTHLTDKKRARTYELKAWSQKGESVTLVHEPLLGTNGFHSVKHQLTLPLNVSEDGIRRHLRSVWMDLFDGENVSLTIREVNKRRVVEPK